MEDQKKQLSDEELVKETEKIVDDAKEEKPTKTPEIKNEQQEIKKVKKEEVEKVLKAINGVAFKFGDCIYGIRYNLYLAS